MRVLVLGHAGMLGSMVTDVFTAKGMDVVTSQGRYDGSLPADVEAELVSERLHAVVNCVGVTDAGADPARRMLANAIFPQHLAARAAAHVVIVHASTDGVFSGCGPHAITDVPSATDAYGLSKRLAETIATRPRTAILRGSIVGPERRGHGFLNWVRRSQGEIRGFRNHLWNGVTTLEWSEVVFDLLRNNGPFGLQHLTCAEAVSKADLARMLVEMFSCPASVVDVDAPAARDLRLVPTIRRAPIRTLLQSLRRTMS